MGNAHAAERVRIDGDRLRVYRALPTAGPENTQMSEPMRDQPGLTSPTCDPLLVDLVRLADTLNVEHGISLTIGGSLLTGTLISAYRFFEAQAAFAMAGSVLGSKDPEAAGAYKQKMVDFYKARMEKVEPAFLSGIADYGPPFIHVHNARWIGNDGMFVGEARFWRGRLAEVSGFAIREV
jgi:hypothetical protein